ncbi:MAG TPA: PP2C family serine/threonine-protein phosphatase [Streptosporangiaceae bacterium]
MTLALRYAVRSDVGLLREGNEDSAYAGPRLLAVADGMGGHAAGEVASAVTIGALAELDTDRPGQDMMADLSNAVASANMRLQQMIMANPAVEGMGTTLTAVLWSDGHAAVCHIGDSRGYLLRDGELYQITHDHTLVQSLVDEGRITEDDVSTHPQRSLLLRALDGRTVAEPDLSMHDAHLGDRYLLCSDGLSGVVSDETLRDTLAGISDPEAATRQLIDLAIRGGGPDNITCIVADVVDATKTRPTTAPVLAGAAANGGDPRAQAPGTNPFAALDGDGRRTPAGAGTTAGTGTAPQPALPDDGEMHGSNGSGPSRQNGSKGPDGALGTQPRRGHRARGRTGRRRWPIVTTSLVVLVAVIVGGGYIAWRYTQDQYFVATDSSDEVAIYQGINQSVLGISLSHPHTKTGIMLNQVPTQFRQQLANTPSASSLSGAQQIVDNIRNQVNACSKWYQDLKYWNTLQNDYAKAVSEATTHHQPTKNIAKPPPEPTDKPANVTCPSWTAYGVQTDQLPANVTAAAQ